MVPPCPSPFSADDQPALQAFLRGAVSPMSEVLQGDFDLRVPVVTAVIDSYTKLSISDVVVELVVSPRRNFKGIVQAGFVCMAVPRPSWWATAAGG